MKLIMLIGISGSGKSTWAADYIQKNPKTVRVNRDNFREMFVADKCKNYKYDSKLEKKMIGYQDYMAVDLLKSGWNVVVDNTHLTIKDYERLKNLANEVGAEFITHIIEVKKKLAKHRVFIRDWQPENLGDEQEFIDYSNEPEVQYIDAQYINFLKIKDFHESLTKAQKL